MGQTNYALLALMREQRESGILKRIEGEKVYPESERRKAHKKALANRRWYISRAKVAYHLWVIAVHKPGTDRSEEIHAFRRYRAASEMLETL